MNTYLSREGGLSRSQPETTPEGTITLSLPGEGRGEDLVIPVGVKNLSTTGIILETLEGAPVDVPETVKGCDAVILLPPNLQSEMAYIRGKVLWTREDGGVCTVGMDLMEPLPTAVRRTLESQMNIVNKDIKELWDQWDQIHGRRHQSPPAAKVAAPEPILKLAPSEEADEETTSSRGNYWVGLGVMGAGTVMQFIGPDYLKFSGLVLIVYGSALVAVKSIWGMWQGRRSQAP